MGYLDSLFGLKGKVAVVTGGNRGVGKVVAEGLARAGAEVAIISRSAAGGAVRNIEEKGGRAYYLIADITDERTINGAMDKIYERSGSLDVVFNNAGVFFHRAAEDADASDWRGVIDVDLTGGYIVARAAGRIMIANKIGGSVVNNASMSGHIVNIPQKQAAYNAAKAGLIHLTRSLAVEWAPFGIRVNSISPGYIATDTISGSAEQSARIPLGRYGTPEELVSAVIYFASGGSAYTTGSDLIIDGGYVCL
jgi:NAD(P)-dependent dehydrogenase (short-subunit alcohol dehydrogenase family)